MNKKDSEKENNHELDTCSLIIIGLSYVLFVFTLPYLLV